MRNRNLCDPVARLCAGGDVVDSVNYFGAVVAHAALITNTDRNSLENDKALLVLKRLLINLFRADGTLTVLTPVAVRRFLSGIC